VPCLRKIPEAPHSSTDLIAFLLLRLARAAKRKTDVAEHVHVLNHVGLLVTGPPTANGLPFA
jgi:hypothetical protein